jgi:predicted alpha/beta-hydrolase family hydrolase
VVGVLDVDTPHGPARVHLHGAEEPAGGLVLGHGAGGGVTARDLVAATTAAQAIGVSVALVEQPYRVAGRRSPAPAGQLDAAWIAVVEQLRDTMLGDLALVVGGRSSGARVACRTAAQTGAVGVLCLAFPVHPPGRPEKTRLGELDAVAVPTLVVQGASDPFGMPPAGARREVVTVPGNHSLTGDLEALRAAVGRFLGAVLGLAQASAG